MRILGRKFYAFKSKNRRKNTPDSAFPRTLDNVYIMPDVNTLFTLFINIPLGGLMQANTCYYRITS